MHLRVPVAQLSREEDDLGNDQFSNGTGVGEGRIEDSDTLLGSVLEIDLIGADAEASNDTELFSSIEDLLGNLGLGTNADAMDITNLLNQLIFRQGLGIGLNLLLERKGRKARGRWWLVGFKNPLCSLGLVRLTWCLLELYLPGSFQPSPRPLLSVCVLSTSESPQ